MKHFNELEITERNEIVTLFAYWLKPYTHEVIKNITCRVNEIINNELVMNMLRELKAREDKEFNDFSHSIGCMLNDFDTFAQYDPHNHPITHARSYRDILYDMYIK